MVPHFSFHLISLQPKQKIRIWHSEHSSSNVNPTAENHSTKNKWHHSSIKKWHPLRSILTVKTTHPPSQTPHPPTLSPLSGNSNFSLGSFFRLRILQFHFKIYRNPISIYTQLCSAYIDMMTKADSPRESISKVFERVGVYGFGGTSSHKRCKYAIKDEEEEIMELEQIGAERTKNVLILMSDTGGGHRASAEAIRDAFQLEYGDQYRIFVKDVWKEYTGWPLNDMESQYKFMVKHVQLWKVAFHGTSPKWIHSIYLAAIAAFYAKEVEAGLMEYKPDIIISVHPMMQHIPLWVLKWQGLQKKVVFVTVITDLSTCHRTWFHPLVNRLYCPSEEVAKRAVVDGLEESRVRVFGLPIRPSFCRAVLSKDDLRVELEMDPELPAVLLMGGGEGMGPVKKTAKALGEALFDKELDKPIGQLVVICGRNEGLANTLKSLEWKIPVQIRGFQKQMEKWMGACDCIITKAGPGTIAEALIRGLPIVLNDYIPGQEKGNVPYVVENGAGVFTRKPKETAQIVSEWFSTKKDELKKMSENALKLAQPDAVFDIVKDIHELACQRGPLANVPYMLTSSFSSLI